MHYNKYTYVHVHIHTLTYAYKHKNEEVMYNIIHLSLDIPTYCTREMEVNPFLYFPHELQNFGILN